jgi:hypothetical protein
MNRFSWLRSSVPVVKRSGGSAVMFISPIPVLLAAPTRPFPSRFFNTAVTAAMESSVVIRPFAHPNLVHRLCSAAAYLGSKSNRPIYGSFSKKIKDKAKEAKLNKDDINALCEAVNSLVHGTQDAATAIQERVGSIILPAVETIVAKVNGDGSLSDQENDIIAPCHEGETGLLDSFLENFGIPNAASAKRIGCSKAA